MICEGEVYGRYYLVCDVCGKEEDKTFRDFYDAVDYKKESGWKSQKYRGEWEDVCPECQHRSASRRDNCWRK